MNKDNLSTKSIVLINQDSGYLMIDIANEFVKKYDKVVLLAGQILPMGQVLHPTIKLVKIKKYNKKNTFSRLFSWIVAFVQILYLLKFSFRKYDLFISSNPPLATLLPLFCSNKTSLLIYDIYPDGLIAGKFFNSNNTIIKIWRKLNILAYKKVNKIITLTNGMSDLISQYVDSSKISIIPAWANKSFEINNKERKENIFIEKYNLQNKFLIVYSGNLGKEYELESLINLAELLTNKDNIQLLIIGDGWQKNKLELMVNELNLKNCLLLPKQSSEMFEALMEAMSMGVVSLGKAVSKIAIPSKTYNILASGKPLLCIGTKDSDLSIMIENHQIGATFQSFEIQKMVKFINSFTCKEDNLYQDICVRAKSTSMLFTAANARKIVELV